MGHYDDQREAMENKGLNSNWYDYEKKVGLTLPPQGTVCQLISSATESMGFDKVKIIEISTYFVAVRSFTSRQVKYLNRPISTSTFRPLDWELKLNSQDVDEKTISLNSTDWYDYDKQAARALPPIGENCQYTLTGNSWFDCLIVSHNKLVINCPHLAEDNENGNGLQCVNPNDIEFRPIDWDKNSEQQALSAEVVYHLSNAFNELNTIIRLLPESDPRHAALVGVAGAVNAIREVA